MEIREKDANISYAHVRSINVDSVDSTNTLPEYEQGEIASLHEFDPIISRVIYWMKCEEKPTVRDLKSENKSVH